MADQTRSATTWRCETCAHFRRLEPDDAGHIWDAPDGIEDDEALRWGTCALVIDTNDAREEAHSERAYPQDASGYRAWLMVREDFGCVEFVASDSGSDRPPS